MAKLSKQQTKLHNQAMDLIHSDKVLSENDIWFFYENYREDASHNTTLNKAFFTPLLLARDFYVGTGFENGKIIDLCAGIGKLSFFNYLSMKDRSNLTCVELNHDYYTIGKRLMPEANWINCSIMELPIPDNKEYELAISNPPFGKLDTELHQSLIFRNKNIFELSTVELATKLAEQACFILPSSVVPFKYSGRPYYEKVVNDKYEKFNKATGIQLDILFSVDCSFYKDDWNSCNPSVELVEWVNDDF